MLAFSAPLAVIMGIIRRKFKISSAPHAVNIWPNRRKP
jgi:hypothetical protein